VQVWAAKERGASLVQYALLVVLIAIISTAVMRRTGKNISTAFSSVGTALGKAMDPDPDWCDDLPSWLIWLGRLLGCQWI
jgi:Flp pilus assembly pilin Flp